MENKEKTQKNAKKPKIELKTHSSLERYEEVMKLINKAKDLDIVQTEIANFYQDSKRNVESTSLSVFNRLLKANQINVIYLKNAIKDAISNKILKLELLKEQIKNL